MFFYFREVYSKALVLYFTELEEGTYAEIIGMMTQFYLSLLYLFLIEIHF